jgi:gluconolactonase
VRTRSIIILSFVVAAATTHAEEWGRVQRLVPALDAVVAADAKVEKLAGDFEFLEGPIWVRNGGYLLFSEMPSNSIRKWNPADGEVSVFLEKSGFTGTDPTGAGGRTPTGFISIGSNGLTLDREGRIVLAAHGDRNVVRLEKDGTRTVLASRYEGKRLNSPNDLIYKSDGSLYFTDPPGGLRERHTDPKKELPFSGVFLLKGDKLQLLVDDLPMPNGVGFSPDEKIFYLSDTYKKIVNRYDVRPDGTLSPGKLLIDMNADQAAGYPDGLRVDQKGNVYSTGPGGFWIVSPAGQHLGTILLSEFPTGLAFGDADGKTLYLTSRTGLYRIRLKVAGLRP